VRWELVLILSCVVLSFIAILVQIKARKEEGQTELRQRIMDYKNLTFKSNKEYMKWVEQSDKEWNNEHGILNGAYSSYENLIRTPMAYFDPYKHPVLESSSSVRFHFQLCRYCGVKIFDEDRFCVACGAPS
jgi:hypothetical protein